MQRGESTPHKVTTLTARRWRARHEADAPHTRPSPSGPRGLYLVAVTQARNTSGGASATSWADFVREHRLASGLTPSALGRRIGVDRGTIYRWEAGTQTPDKLDVIARFAALFRIDLDAALAVAGLRPAVERDDVVAPEPAMAFDPDVVELQRMLNDPATPPEIKAQIRATARMLRELATQIAAERPGRRRRLGLG